MSKWYSSFHSVFSIHVIHIVRKQEDAQDKKEIEALLKDVTSGALRKRGFGVNQRALRLNGGISKGFEFDDEDDTDIIARLKSRYSRYVRNGEGDDGDELYGDDMTGAERYVANPETAVFGKCFDRVVQIEGFLSSEDEEKNAGGSGGFKKGADNEGKPSEESKRELRRLKKSFSGSCSAGIPQGRSWLNKSAEATPNISLLKKQQRQSESKRKIVSFESEEEDDDELSNMSLGGNREESPELTKKKFTIEDMLDEEMGEEFIGTEKENIEVISLFYFSRCN